MKTSNSNAKISDRVSLFNRLVRNELEFIERLANVQTNLRPKSQQLSDKHPLVKSPT